MRAIIDAEAALFARKRELQPRHINEHGESEVATLSMLATNQATNPVEERRRSSFEGFREIERWVLDNGFLDLVKLRNRFARALGFDNYFELKLRKNERMTPGQLEAHPGRLRRPHRRDQRAHPGRAESHAWRAGARAVEPALLRRRRRGAAHGRVHAVRPGAAPLGAELPPPGHPVPRRHHAAGSAGARRQVSERLLPRSDSHLGERDGRVGARSDQLHRRSQARSGRQRTRAPSTPCSTRAATPRTSPTWRRTRPASRRNMRRPRWPMPRRSRCSATACSATRTGSSGTPATRTAKRFRTR